MEPLTSQGTGRVGIEATGRVFWRRSRSSFPRRKADQGWPARLREATPGQLVAVAAGKRASGRETYSRSRRGLRRGGGAGAPGGTNVVPGGPPSALGSLAAALSRRVLWPHGRAGRGAGLRLALTTSRGLCGARESRSQSWRHRSSHRRRQPCGPLPRNRCSRRRHRLRTHVSRADGRKRVSHSLAQSCVPPAAHPCRPQAGVPTCAAWGSGSAAPGCPG